MALLTPNATATMLGVTVNEKIIPDGYRWKSASKAKAAGFDANALFKANEKLNGDGKAQFVTIHNTNDLKGVYDDAEQYTRATYPNENMNSSRVHYYVDDTGAWQNLKAGTGLFPADPEGSAEVSWHAGDGSVSTGGNMTSLSIEIIMNESTQHDAMARDNGARVAAWLLRKHGLSIDRLVTHTYWVNKAAGKNFTDPDIQSTNMVKRKKWCPSYIFASNNVQVARKNWLAFKALVKEYLDELNDEPAKEPENFQVGDVVEFIGTKHHTNSNSTNGKTCKPGKAKVTAMAKTGKHPVHLVAVKGGGSTVYGWVDTAAVKRETATLAVGAKVTVNKGAKTYTGFTLASFVFKTTYEVLQIDADRVVIGLNGKVTAAVKAKDLTLV